MNDLGDKAKSPETKEKIRTTAQKATEFAGDVFHNMIHVFGKIKDHNDITALACQTGAAAP